MLLKLLLAARLCVGISAPGYADLAVTTAPSTMRRAPNPHSHFVQNIPANALIDLQNCDGNWCFASWRNLFGYIPAVAVGGAAVAVSPQPVVVAPSPPVVIAPSVVVGSTWGWGGPFVGGYYGYGWRHW